MVATREKRQLYSGHPDCVILQPRARRRGPCAVQKNENEISDSARGIENDVIQTPCLDDEIAGRPTRTILYRRRRDRIDRIPLAAQRDVPRYDAVGRTRPHARSDKPNAAGPLLFWRIALTFDVITRRVSFAAINKITHRSPTVCSFLESRAKRVVRCAFHGQIVL